MKILFADACLRDESGTRRLGITFLSTLTDEDPARDADILNLNDPALRALAKQIAKVFLL